MGGLVRDNHFPWKSVLGAGAQRAVRPPEAHDDPVGGYQLEYEAIDLEVRCIHACKAKGLYLHIYHTGKCRIKYVVSSVGEKAHFSTKQKGVLWVGECTESASRNSRNYTLLLEMVEACGLDI